MASTSPSSSGHQPHDATSSEVSVTPNSNRPPETRKHSHHPSISSRHSSHQEYIDSLPVPPASEVARIESVQIQKEDEKTHHHRQQSLDADTPAHRRSSEEGRGRNAAAELIQRNYRGYRERRQMRGWGLDPGSRWVEAFKEARYRNLTTPRARSSIDEGASRPGTAGGEDGSPVSASGKRLSGAARANWTKVSTIVRRAANDEDSSSESSGEDETAGEIRRFRAEKKEERRRSAKTMDLQYWLEMVDVRHRYGSNLRTYHQEWQRAETKENFFYWLDYGEGRRIECAGCPRERLERERVRYLGKEERLDYLVRIDGEGRLCWAKDGMRIDTSTKFRDSLHGIVPVDSDAPMFNPEDGDHTIEPSHTGTTSPSDSDSEKEAETQHYATDSFDNARGVKKVKHVSPSTIFNKLLRSSVKKNTWIFVADTNFRLYVGIKQSGAFQHSSFLHGSRISAAGLIKIKDGRLDKLSPLSGHYRPPVSSFRAFVHALREGGVDMSHVSISRSYAVLVGLEAYVKTRRRGKRVVGKLLHGRDKILSPDEVRRREEEERDKSESAERERRVLEVQREEGRGEGGLLRRLHIGMSPRGRGGEEGGV
ncbi:hypothetical protein VE02_02046 [Pseudogymnoascus sp. 03VT05]|nr:hypothetical protein VE02_02046 [Pseudogymnoascus sp. 03VT05]